MRNAIRLLLVVGVLSAPRIALGQAPVSSQATSKPPFVPWQTEEPLLVSGNKAVYAGLAAIVHAEGCVYVGTIVADDGSTTNVAFLTGSLLLMKSAVDAVTNWRFAPSKREIMTVIPVCFFASGDDRQKLLSGYQKAAEKHRDSKDFGALAYELLLTGSPDDAAKQFRQALALKAGDADARLGLADSLAAKGDLDGAIDAYQQGLAAAPKNEPARIKLAESLRYDGDLDGAITQYRIVLKSDSGNGSCRAKLAGLLLEKGDLDGAIEQYEKGLHDDRFDNPSGHYGLGQAYEKKGDTADALRQYKEAMREMPQNIEFQDAYNRLSSH